MNLKGKSAKSADEQPTIQHSSTVDTMASEEAVPVEKGDIGGLLVERLRAWKHAVGYIQVYITSTGALHKSMAREYEKVTKVRRAFTSPHIFSGGRREVFSQLLILECFIQAISEPLKEGHHFGNGLGSNFPSFEGFCY